MYIIVSKHNQQVYNYGKELEYQDNGNPLLVDRNVAFMATDVSVFEVSDSDIPEDIDIGRYLYTVRGGFKHSADYVAGENNWGLPESILAEIKSQAIQEVQDELNAETTGTGEPA